MISTVIILSEIICLLSFCVPLVYYLPLFDVNMNVTDKIQIVWRSYSISLLDPIVMINLTTDIIYIYTLP